MRKAILGSLHIITERGAGAIMSTSIVDAVAPTSVTEDLALLDHIHEEMRSKRNTLINKLEPIVTGLTISPSEARVTEVQMQIVNAYRSLLNDNEASIGRRVSSKLKQVEADSAGKHNAAVAELLSSISIANIRVGNTTQQPDAETAEKSLETAFSAHDLSIVLESELKTDPKDITT